MITTKSISIIALALLAWGCRPYTNIQPEDLVLNIAYFEAFDRDSGESLRVVITNPSNPLPGRNGRTFPLVVSNPTEGPSRVTWVGLNAESLRIAREGYQSVAVEPETYKLINSTTDKPIRVEMEKIQVR